MGIGGFYKGEKKKQKKGKEKRGDFASNAPTFVLPKLVSKKKNES